MKNFVAGVLAGLMLAGLVFGVVQSQAQAQAAVMSMGPKNTITWAAVAVNADGTACQDLAGYQVAVFPDLLPLTAPLKTVVVGPEAVELQAAGLFLGLTQGAAVRVAVLAFDTAGNQSAWSESLQGVLDFVAPGTPGRPGCAITR